MTSKCLAVNVWIRITSKRGESDVSVGVRYWGSGQLSCRLRTGAQIIYQESKKCTIVIFAKNNEKKCEKKSDRHQMRIKDRADEIGMLN